MSAYRSIRPAFNLEPFIIPIPPTRRDEDEPPTRRDPVVAEALASRERGLPRIVKVWP